MSENTEMDPHAKVEPAGDRVGDILRKERITRRIALETIAKDLKLNVKYIKSLEANDYSDLPADPYIRVYFRSIAKYLLLDPRKFLSVFTRNAGSGGSLQKRLEADHFLGGKQTDVQAVGADRFRHRGSSPFSVLSSINRARGIRAQTTSTEKKRR